MSEPGGPPPPASGRQAQRTILGIGISGLPVVRPPGQQPQLRAAGEGAARRPAMPAVPKAPKSWVHLCLGEPRACDGKRQCM